MALLCFQVSSAALDRCQCHSNVAGCVIVSSRQPFSTEYVKGSFFSVGLLECGKKPSGACLFLVSPHADCIVTDLISIEKFEETLLG